ncbi:MAG: hypothetical protein ABJL99_15830 [Aliishimia sp.]
MNKASMNWRRLKRATLERTQRSAIDPLQPICTLFAILTAIYLGGVSRFTLLSAREGNYTWFDAFQLVSTALSGLLLPVLAGAVMILCFVSKKIEKLILECD